MRFHMYVRLGGAIACIVGTFTNDLFCMALGIVGIIFSSTLQGDNLERRLDTLEGDNNVETKK